MKMESVEVCAASENVLRLFSFILRITSQYSQFFQFSGPPAVRPVPAPKPSVKPQPRRPRVKAIHDYTAADTDEISIAQGEILELVKEGQLKGLKLLANATEL